MASPKAPASALDPVLPPEQLSAVDGLILCDVRTGPDAREAFLRGHLPGAVFVDLELDLSGPKHDPARGGRHPLPDGASFAARLGALGIGPESHVVAYDAQGGANAAARLWWML